MKIKPDLFNRIVESFKKIKEKYPLITPAYYAQENIGKDTNMRFRWDVFHAARMHGRPTINELYKFGIHDTHIDTTLKNAVKIVWG